MTIKIITLVLMAVFYICYFAKMYSQRKQGIETDQLGKGKEGFVKFVEVTLKITTYLLPMLQIISIWLCEVTAHMWLRITGIIVTAVGVLIFVISVVQMKDSWRAGVQREEKTNLVTTGIYSISRNPAFLGFDLMYLGILFSFFNWVLCFATSVALIFFHLQIVNVEEDFLVEAFGEEYLNYKAKVCRYLGRKLRKKTLKFAKDSKMKNNIDFTTITACGECCVGCKKKEDGICQGCIESDGHCIEWTQSNGCPIHKCAREHNVQFCGLCKEFPCEWLIKKVVWKKNMVEKLTELSNLYRQQK